MSMDLLRVGAGVVVTGVGCPQRVQALWVRVVVGSVALLCFLCHCACNVHALMMPVCCRV